MIPLLRFVLRVLRLAPPLLWWALGGLVFSLLNNALHQELWPNTPAARPFFLLMMYSCLMILPWLATRLAWQLADIVQSFFWKALWRFAAIAGYGGAVLSLLGGLVALFFLAADFLEKLHQ